MTETHKEKSGELQCRTECSFVHCDTELPDFEELEDFRRFFSLHLQSIPASAQPPEKPEVLSEEPRLREEAAITDLPVKEGAPASTAKETSIKHPSLSTGERGALLEKLRNKIQGIQEETGSLKIRRTSHHDRASGREARKQRRRRRALAKNKTKNPKAEVPKSTQCTTRGLAFSEVRSEPMRTSGSRPGKRKLSEKFRKLKIAKRQQEATQQFQQTGLDGQKVLETEWDFAFRRASGQHVLDDPKKIQKSIDDRFKQKVRSAKQWEARLEATRKLRTQQQERRKTNLRRRQRNERGP